MFIKCLCVRALGLGNHSDIDSSHEGGEARRGTIQSPPLGRCSDLQVPPVEPKGIRRAERGQELSVEVPGQVSVPSPAHGRSRRAVSLVGFPEAEPEARVLCN